MAKSVLSLSTETPASAPLTIDGTEYRIATMGELSMVDQKRIADAAARSGQLDDMSDEQLEALSEDLRVCIHAVLPDAPADVVAKLNDGQRMLVVASFYNEAAKAAKAATKTAKGTKTSSRSSKSTRASNGSTAARPRTGSA